MKNIKTKFNMKPKLIQENNQAKNLYLKLQVSLLIILKIINFLKLVKYKYIYIVNDYQI